MNLRRKDAFLASVGFLILVGLLLGFRSYRSVRVVMAPGEVPPEAAAGSEPADMSLMTAIAKDSLVAHAQMSDRDPFRPPPWRPSGPRPTPKPPEPTPEPPPTVSARLVDTVNPSVKLRANSSESPWLQEGDSFRGWAVVSITSDSVTVYKEGRFEVLR